MSLRRSAQLATAALAISGFALATPGSALALGPVGASEGVSYACSPGVPAACIQLTMQAVGAPGVGAAPLFNTEFTCTATAHGLVTAITINYCSAAGVPAAVTGMIGVATTSTGGFARATNNIITVCMTATAQVAAATDFTHTSCQDISVQLNGGYCPPMRPAAITRRV